MSWFHGWKTPRHPSAWTSKAPHVAPNEHTFYLTVESDTMDGLTELLGPPVLQDYEADVVPVTTFGEVMDTFDVE